MLPTAKKLLEIVRFFSHVDKGKHGTGCWNWTGGTKGGQKGNEYGAFFVGSRTDKSAKCVLAHRWSFLHHFGKLTPGLLIHHKCENKLCVNPAHLQQVTNSTNVKRGLPGRRLHDPVWIPAYWYYRYSSATEGGSLKVRVKGHFRTL